MKTKYRILATGDVVQAGDFTLGKTRVTITQGNRWLAHVIWAGTPVQFGRRLVPDKPQLDPVMARALRLAKQARSRTTLGRLEALRAQRAVWQRKQTLATTKVAALQRLIDELAGKLAGATFEAEIAALAPTDQR